MKPVVRRLEEEFQGKLEFKALNIDDAANDAAKATYKFRFQPQFVIATADNQVIVSRNGVLQYEQLKADIEKALASTN
jgi:hypothetical protein